MTVSANKQSNLSYYAEDALTFDTELDPINSADADTLDRLFRERVRRSSEEVAYNQFDADKQQWNSYSWSQIAAQVERWQVAFREAGLVKADRVAICYRNSIEWIIFDQAALRLGLVVVPLYTADRADNIGYVIGNSQAKLVLFADLARWLEVVECDEDVSCLETVLLFAASEPVSGKVKMVADWLPEIGSHLERGLAEPDDLATIIYTSGTTGRPKGVMLSHKNLLSNAYNGMRSVALKTSDHLLSFLPLSHALERTIGYYAPMLMGAKVSFNRSIPELAEDLKTLQPSVLISVPRIFERVHNQIYSKVATENKIKQTLFRLAIDTGWHRFKNQQGRAAWHPKLLLAKLLDHLVAKPIRENLGGNLDFVIVGGAALSEEVAKTFIALGVPLLQGYGLTESSPVVSVNTPKRNLPNSIGLALRGVKVKIGEQDELWVQGNNVMQGYWLNDQATKETIVEMEDGQWLKTGDRAAIDEQGFIRIIGRIKDIIVLANGEKMPPTDIEAAILRDPLFEQVLVLGEGRSFLSALVVLNKSNWLSLASENRWQDAHLQEKAVQDTLINRIGAQMVDFPGYAKIRKVTASLDEWTVESGLLTPTLKIKRPKVLAAHETEIEQMYAGRGVHKA
ncbi:MAG: AMP-dependent synthetase/ligase [Acidiferrobacterales bacterium]|nr:AMP-dependent synthetase/ligase [Acidiferrobacterales bacterium]